MLKFSVNFNYPHPVSNSLIMGTLGPKGTSSEHTSDYLAIQLKEQGIYLSVKLFDDFLLVKEALLQEQIDWALVPHAYDKINEFYMEPSLILGFIFIHSTPAYGLAKKKDQAFNLEGATIVSHPAPLPLLPKLLPDSANKEIQVILANSTSAAAILVEQGLADFAITNEHAAKAHGLEFVSMYGEITMSWAIFYKDQRGKHV